MCRGSGMGGHDFRQGRGGRSVPILRGMKDRSALLARTAGLAVCAVAAMPVWLPALQRPGSALTLRSALAMAGYVLFAACFWKLSSPACDRPGRPVSLFLIAVQTLTGIVLFFQVHNGMTGALAVLVATVLLDALPLAGAVLLLAVQTLAFAIAMGRLPIDRWELAAIVLSYSGFEIFALYISHVARSERQGREELARVNAELLATRRLLADSSRAAERLRISRELHDVLGHHLAALSLHLEAARHAPAGETAAHVETAQTLTRHTLQEIRRVVGRLREDPPVDLPGALADLAAGVAVPQVHLSLPEDLRLDDPERAHTLFRCAQEALTNAVRHAGARNLWLELVQGTGGLELQARDDGRGAGTVEAGNGLNGMRERLEALGGRLAVESAPGQGFRVRAWLPLASSGGALP
jgi:signal transduction histidine kinase